VRWRLGRRLSFALAIAAGLTMVAVALLVSDPSLVAKRLLAANPLYVMLACLLDLAAIVFFALAWVVVAKAVGVRIGAADGLVASILGLVADKLVASGSVSGELVRLAYVRRRSRADYASLLATIVVHRFLYNVAFLALLAVASADLAARRAMPRAVLAVAGLGLASMAVASYVLVRLESLRGVFGFLAERVGGLVARSNPVLAGELAAKVDAFVASVVAHVRSALRKRAWMALGVALMLLQWIAGAAELGALFQSIGYPVDFWVLALAFPLHCYLTALPVGIPAALGVTEVGTLFVLAALGVERSAAMAVTVLVRFVEVWFELALGAIAAAVGGVALLRPGWRESIGLPRGEGREGGRG